MGEIRIKVNLTNAVDDDLASQGRLSRDEVRRLEVTAVIDTGTVTTVLPAGVVEQLGLSVRGRRVAQYADGRKDNVGITNALIDIGGKYQVFAAEFSDDFSETRFVDWKFV